MTINYIPNDPAATGPAMRQIAPHPGRSAGQARFEVLQPAAEGQHPPQSDPFLHWQSREAAYRALDLWDVLHGTFDTWANGKLKLNLVPHTRGPNRPGAFYDRNAIMCYRFSRGGIVRASAASTDVVAHEAGHAFLDQMRPDLFHSSMLELAAFHEAFADCIALLVAFEDLETRQQVANHMDRANFVEALMEDQALALADIDADHNSAVPRHARNALQWVLPTHADETGGPGALIHEEHSFSRIFTGCFYDLLVALYDPAAGPDEARLSGAARRAGKLLVTAAGSATLEPRMFKSVGNAMLLADQAQSGGAHQVAIRHAFAGHGIDINLSQMMQPAVALAGRAPAAKAKRTGDVLTRASRRDLLTHLGATSLARVAAAPAPEMGQQVFKARCKHHVVLGNDHGALADVVAGVEEDVLIGASGDQAAILGRDVGYTAEAEVSAYVATLARHNRIGDAGTAEAVSHSINEVDGEKRLVRVGFACGCGRHGQGQSRHHASGRG